MGPSYFWYRFKFSIDLTDRCTRLLALHLQFESSMQTIPTFDFKSNKHDVVFHFMSIVLFL